jgi:nucleoside-diphosphate-sugar epimerase
MPIRRKDAHRPEQYIEKISLLTGEPLDEPYDPAELLVNTYRDRHPLDILAQLAANRIADFAGDDELARQTLRLLKVTGRSITGFYGRLLRSRKVTELGNRLLGISGREYLFRFKEPDITPKQREQLVRELQEEAAEKMRRLAEASGGTFRARVLLTGGTGFLGKEIISQALGSPVIESLAVLIRPKVIRDRKSGEVIEELTPQQRGERLLEELGLSDHPERGRIRFVAGDTEKPAFGIAEDELRWIEEHVTHLVHCAASVAFDAPYDDSFAANVTGTRNALELARRLQSRESGPFVATILIETAYTAGRQVRTSAKEGSPTFPRSFYNNYYEVTKAMASIEADRQMVAHRLRIAQLCPAIVIGNAATGNNRGDTKVVNAPINAFGRAYETLRNRGGSLSDQLKGRLIAYMALIFSGDREAELNLVPVDRVVKGIIAALDKPRAIGERIHLATDDRLKLKVLRSLVKEELGVNVMLADPVIHRNFTLPVLSAILSHAGQPKLAHALNKLGLIFGGYTERGQPVHSVGKDVQILGLEKQKPNTVHAFRMLCRHNKYVQRFGRVRDPMEIARRERLWSALLEQLETERGTVAAAIPPDEFREWLEQHIDLETFLPLQS